MLAGPVTVAVPVGPSAVAVGVPLRQARTPCCSISLVKQLQRDISLLTLKCLWNPKAYAEEIVERVRGAEGGISYRSFVANAYALPVILVSAQRLSHSWSDVYGSWTNSITNSTNSITFSDWKLYLEFVVTYAKGNESHIALASVLLIYTLLYLRKSLELSVALAMFCLLLDLGLPLDDYFRKVTGILLMWSLPNSMVELEHKAWADVYEAGTSTLASPKPPMEGIVLTAGLSASAMLRIPAVRPASCVFLELCIKALTHVIFTYIAKSVDGLDEIDRHVFHSVPSIVSVSVVLYVPHDCFLKKSLLEDSSPEIYGAQVFLVVVLLSIGLGAVLTFCIQHRVYLVLFLVGVYMCLK